jgi:acetyltransferase-like isoleucine patch superfamily enzyme
MAARSTSSRRWPAVSARIGASARAARRRARFAAWTGRLRVELARKGAKLELDAPHGADFDDPPLVKVRWAPPGGATFTLRLGEHVHLGRHTVLDLSPNQDGLLEIADEVVFGQGARIWLRGGAVRLGYRAQVRDYPLLKSDGDLRIGARVLVGHAAVRQCTPEIVVGDDCGLAERVSIIDSDHGADGSDAFYLDQPLRVAPVRLERNVLVSANAVLLRDTHVGANSVVAAGSVLTGGRFPGGSLIGGVPARTLKALGNDE